MKLDKLLSLQRKKYFLKSFFKKANRLIVDFVPLDEITPTYCSESILVEDTKTTTAFTPKEFDKDEKKVETGIFPVKIYALKNGYVTPNSACFLTKNLKAIYFEKWHEDQRDIYVYNSPNLLSHGQSLAKVNNLPKALYDIDAVFFGGTFTGNYYHFLLEIISKAEFLANIPGSADLAVILDISVQQNDNLKTIAEFFLKGYRLQYLNHDQYHGFKTLWFITSPNTTIPNISEGSKYEAQFTKISEKSVRFIREKVLENYDVNKVRIENAEKVFIARKSEFRKYNETELLAVAEKYGFKAVCFEELNIHEQIFLLQNADYIIGPSGAAFTNLIFAKENSKGLIWLGSVWSDFSVFSTLAKFVNFDLYYYRYKSESSDFHENYKIDINIFERQIIQLLSR
ncbi:glycosyltransferase family 61 protein [Chryseobacterium salivictor]|uniref:Glycosyltransferase 61 catalytic domain-containing protein n=1 Tax=Chryseobacterium salivictor TaxID=2547600 RepID=A0A4P6ZFD9_9FLAO|nr:glycosyltransferase family 61 protein [Chryseobacterium salivictor]QBO58182.1 hypothetical protein NBC122_01355 [Chryseobacterium salivictor]